MDERLTRETLSNLVTQFSSAWDYLRELVQNSIDAGSTNIEVWTEFEAGPEEAPESGVISIHVDDFGAGMTEEIIDQQLTQLFSSAKENDLTKIGKFGIGFVSVFALQPAGVLVHTGRGGEWWEVFFHADLSFTKTRIDRPVEGTQITSFLAGDAQRYGEVVERVESTLRKWCAHSDTEISFEDRSAKGGHGPRPINAPFEVEGEFMTEAREGELEMVMAYSRTPVFGFYNRGLALAVGSDPDAILGEHADRFRHLAFKVKSPWLEHTLSRETVMRDEHFEQAMVALAQVARHQVRERLLEALESACAEPHWSLARRSDYVRWLGYLAHEPTFVDDESLASRPILRCIDGRATSLQALWEAFEDQDYVYLCSEPTALTRVLATREVPVLLEPPPPASSPVRAVVGRYLGARQKSRLGRRVLERMGLDEHIRQRNLELVDPHLILCSVDLEAEFPPGLKTLFGHCLVALRSVGRRYKEVHLAEITSEAGYEPLFVLGPELDALMLRPTDAVYVRERWKRPRLIIDHRHPHVREMLALAEADLELAVYCLCRALLLHEDRLAPPDAALMAAVRHSVKEHG